MNVSIIIPAFRNEKQIARCINALCALNFPKKSIEIFVIDDCSPDKTFEKAKEALLFKGKEQFKKAEVIKNRKELGVSGTRNAGLKKASGDFIAFIDGDMVCEKNFLKKALAWMKNKKIGGVAASCPFEGKESIVEKAYAGMKESKTPARNAFIGTGCTLYRKAAIKGLFFDEKIFLPSFEDADFAISVIEKGFETISDPGISALHLRSTNFKKECGVLFRKGRDQPFVFAKHKSQRSGVPLKNLKNSVFFLSLFLIIPWLLIILAKVIKDSKNFKKNALLNSFVFSLLDFSRSAGYFYGMIYWVGKK